MLPLQPLAERSLRCVLEQLIGWAHSILPMITRNVSSISYYFDGGSLGIAIEDRINLFHNVSTHIKEVSLVLDRNERPLCAIVLCYLKRLCEGSERFDVSLNAHVAKYKQCGTDGRFAKGRIGRHKKRDPDLYRVDRRVSQFISPHAVHQLTRTSYLVLLKRHLPLGSRSL